MPFAGFPDFDACVLHMKEKEGHDEESAKKICGKLQAEAEMEGLTELDKSLIVELQCREADLPKGAFAYSDNKGGHLPHHGMDGAVKCNCVRAALQAMGGARTGKPMTGVPDSAKAHLMKHAKECGIETANAAFEMPAGKEPVEMVIGQKNVNFTEEPNGDTVFHNVTLMAEGTWTDSYSKQPNYYSADEVLKMKIEKVTLKMHHDIFNQLPVTNEIGVVENLKFLTDPARWKGDVRVFPTQNGKDVALLLRRGQFRAISPEMFRTPIYDKENNRIIAKDLSFMGAATVREGACSLCTFNEGTEMAKEYSKDEMKDMLSYMKSHPDMMDDDMKGMMKSMMGGGEGNRSMMSKGDESTTDGTPPNSGGTAGTGGATVELNNEQKQRIAALEAQVKEAQNKTSAEFIAQHEAIVKENTYLKEQVALLQKQVADIDYQKRVVELEHQLKAISSQPVIHTRITATGSSGKAVELDSDPDYPYVSVRELE